MSYGIITDQLERLKNNLFKEKNEFFETAVMDNIHYGIIEKVDLQYEKTHFFIIAYKVENEKVFFKTAHKEFDFANREPGKETPFIDEYVVLKEPIFNDWKLFNQQNQKF